MFNVATGVGTLESGATGLVATIDGASDAARIAAGRSATGYFVRIDALGLEQLLLSWTAVSTPNQLALNEVLAASAAERERFGYIRGFRGPGAEQRLAGFDWAPFASIYGTGVPADRVAEEVAFFSQPGVLTAALNWYRAMTPGDAAGLGPVTVPTAYVWGSADLAFSREAATRTQHFVAGPYRFVALDAAGHWLPDEAPDTLAEVIAEQVSGG